MWRRRQGVAGRVVMWMCSVVLLFALRAQEHVKGICYDKTVVRSGDTPPTPSTQPTPMTHCTVLQCELHFPSRLISETEVLHTHTHHVMWLLLPPHSSCWLWGRSRRGGIGRQWPVVQWFGYFRRQHREHEHERAAAIGPQQDTWPNQWHWNISI